MPNQVKCLFEMPESSATSFERAEQSVNFPATAAFAVRPHPPRSP
jgi:hypothetical protein